MSGDTRGATPYSADPTGTGQGFGVSEAHDAGEGAGAPTAHGINYDRAQGTGQQSNTTQFSADAAGTGAGFGVAGAEHESGHGPAEHHDHAHHHGPLQTLLHHGHHHKDKHTPVSAADAMAHNKEHGEPLGERIKEHIPLTKEHAIHKAERESDHARGTYQTWIHDNKEKLRKEEAEQGIQGNV
eukprot:jgi/Chrzof1/9906/Cz04g20110.t1